MLADFLRADVRTARTFLGLAETEPAIRNSDPVEQLAGRSARPTGNGCAGSSGVRHLRRRRARRPQPPDFGGNQITTELSAYQAGRVAFRTSSMCARAQSGPDKTSADSSSISQSSMCTPAGISRSGLAVAPGPTMQTINGVTTRRSMATGQGTRALRKCFTLTLSPLRGGEHTP
jgi:hypothetical protein